MMTSRETRNRFNYLSLPDKAALVDGYGHHVISIASPDGKYDVRLYEIDCVYVEVFYNLHTRMVDQIWMPSYWEMDAYASNVSIKDLYV